MLKKRNGFSLIELLIVLALTLVVFTMVINFSRNNTDRWALRDITREITSIYYQAKQRAARENASIRLEVQANSYAIYREKNVGVWAQVIRKETFPKKIIASSIADFLINPSGFIINRGTMAIASIQSIVLQAPRGSFFDTMTITIYPYGGLRVDKAFK